MSSLFEYLLKAGWLATSQGTRSQILKLLQHGGALNGRQIQRHWQICRYATVLPKSSSAQRPKRVSLIWPLVTGARRMPWAASHWCSAQSVILFRTAPRIVRSATGLKHDRSGHATLRQPMTPAVSGVVISTLEFYLIHPNFIPNNPGVATLGEKTTVDPW